MIVDDDVDGITLSAFGNPSEYVAGRNTRPRNAVILIFDTFHRFQVVAQVAPRATLPRRADPQRGRRIRVSVFGLQIRDEYGGIRRVDGSERERLTLMLSLIRFTSHVNSRLYNALLKASRA